MKHSLLLKRVLFYFRHHSLCRDIRRDCHAGLFRQNGVLTNESGICLLVSSPTSLSGPDRQGGNDSLILITTLIIQILFLFLS